MQSLEDKIVRDVILYTIVGMLLRLMIFNLPPLSQVWLLVLLSLCIGMGGTLLNLGRITNNKRLSILGLTFVIVGFSPWQLLLL
jgi:hypothetical protein